MTTNFQEVFNGGGDGLLTPEQAVALISAMDEGDTDAQALETDGAPATVTAPSNGQEAVILARDGKHHIPYSQLTDARNDAQNWRAQAEAAQVELESLRQQAQARADAGLAPTKTDNMVAAADAAIEAGADVSMFGDFSEEALANGILSAVKSEVATALKPLRQKEEQERTQMAEAARDTHINSILAAHPDAVSVYQSTQLQAWIERQPFYAQPGIRAVLDQGDTKQVIELFDTYKKDAGIAPARNGNRAATAKAAAAAAVYEPPASLSDIPGGRAGAYSVADRLQGLSGPELIAAMDGLPDDVVEAYLNRDG